MARQISLKYAGECRGCQRHLACGAWAWWSQGRGVACLTCGSAAIDYPSAGGYRSGRVINGQVLAGSRASSGVRVDSAWGSGPDTTPRIVTVHLWRDDDVCRWVWTVVATAAMTGRKSGLARSERAARRRALRRYSYHLRRGWSPGGLFAEMPGRAERIAALEAEVLAPFEGATLGAFVDG